MNGTRYPPADTTGHLANPVQGTWVTKEDKPVTVPLGNEGFPVSARCKRCGGKIRLDHPRQMEWRHAPVKAAAPAPPAGDAP